MTNDDTVASCQWLCEMVAHQMGLSVDQVHPQMRLVGDLGMDSLELQSLLMAIEDALDVIPQGTQLQRVMTVSDLHTLVLQLVDAKRH